MKRHQYLRMVIREMILQEGIYDPGIFKAVFMAGGPGSGKSHTAKLVFGGDITSGVSSATASGLKLVNSDPAFEHLLSKSGVDPSELSDMSDEEFARLTVGPDSPRGKAKSLRDRAQSNYLEGKLGVVIDGTGDDYDKIAAKKEAMEKAGYDTMMVFVNTSLRVAKERNNKRKRKLPEWLVEEVWNDVQENMGKFQSLFGGGNFTIVDNTQYGPIPGSVEKAVASFLRQPVKNPIGKEWINSELTKKGTDAVLPKKKVRGGGNKAKRRSEELENTSS